MDPAQYIPEEGFRKANALREKIYSETTEVMTPCSLTVSGGTVSLSQTLNVLYKIEREKDPKEIAEAMHVFSDFAMYHAKDAGKNCVRSFSEAIMGKISPKRRDRLGDFAELVEVYKRLSGV